MATINLYKISLVKVEGLLEYLSSSYEQIGRVDIAIENRVVVGEHDNFVLSLFCQENNVPKQLSWNWALEAFGVESRTFVGNPKAVIIVQNEDSVYAITFGHSYFKIDQFSNKEWPFDFARRLSYQTVKTTAITNPNSRRNRSVNTYLEYDSLDLGSGEALNKLKARVSLPESITYFTDVLDFGNSIKLNMEEDSLRNVCHAISYIEFVIQNETEKVRIPLFKEIKDTEIIDSLRQSLLHDVENNPRLIDISEYQIYATQLVFPDNSKFKLKLKRRHKESENISVNDVIQFLEENNFSIEDNLLNVKVEFSDDEKTYTKKIEELIFYTNDDLYALLSDGTWYRFNEDYIQYLTDSISEIPVEFDERYNYSRNDRNQFIDRYIVENEGSDEFQGLNHDQIRKKVERKYYREYYYNTWIASFDEGFSLGDRDFQNINGHQLELADLFRGNSMFTVKFGKGSGELCYAVDQSLEAIYAYHRGDVNNENTIENVYIWLVLERGELPIVDGRPDINQLRMLMLKNKIDHWKKEVRLLGYRPMIKINYSVD